MLDKATLYHTEGGMIMIFRGWPVTGIIVEPIQAEGGDHHGSNAWFQVIQSINLAKSSDFRDFKRSAKGGTLSTS